MLDLLAQINLPGLGEDGPGGVRQLLSVFYALFGLGFLVSVLGHVVRSRGLQAAGILMIMVGTAFFMAAVGSSG